MERGDKVEIRALRLVTRTPPDAREVWVPGVVEEDLGDAIVVRYDDPETTRPVLAMLDARPDPVTEPQGEPRWWRLPLAESAPPEGPDVAR